MNQATAVSTARVADENQLHAYRDLLARDPKNVQAAVNAGNLLYDAQRYSEAIGFYQQAFALNEPDRQRGCRRSSRMRAAA